MTQNQLMTAAAVGFAAFAVIHLTRSAGAPAVAVSAQPGQRQRDAGLAAWNDTLVRQAGTFSGSLNPSLDYLALWGVDSKTYLKP